MPANQGAAVNLKDGLRRTVVWYAEKRRTGRPRRADPLIRHWPTVTGNLESPIDMAPERFQLSDAQDHDDWLQILHDGEPY